MSGRPAGRERREWSRPDASMSLLADLFSGRLLDPGYAEAAERRAAVRAVATADSGGGTGTGAGPDGRPVASPGRAAGFLRRRVWHAGVLVVLASAALLVVVAGQQARRAEPVAQRERARLLAEIRTRTAETDALQRRLEELRGSTERLRAVSLTRSDEGRYARQRLAHAAAAAAAAPVSGRGVEVTLDDAEGAAEAGNGPDGPAGQAGERANGTDGVSGRIYDQDLQLLVNGLWASGATAIAVNGLRLTSTTAIRAAGEAILVDYRPLTTPYRVVALGDPATLRRRLSGSAAARRLRALAREYGIRFDTRTVDRARVPAGVVRPRHARAEQEARG